MSKKPNSQKFRQSERETEPRLHPDTKNSILAVVLLGVSAILILAYFGKSGPLGNSLYKIIDVLFGWGYFALPFGLVLAAGVFITSGRRKIFGLTLLGSGLLILSVLGLIEIGYPGNGGWLGKIFGIFKYPLGNIAATLVNVVVVIISFLIILNLPLKFSFRRNKVANGFPAVDVLNEPAVPIIENKSEKAEKKDKDIATTIEEKVYEVAPKGKKSAETISTKPVLPINKNYVFPSLSLLKSGEEKPSTGDLRANANIIKRTLESFGIPVEMGEINVGPAVTRYTLKPAEGVKLSKITALNQDLAMALAAHPIRIEAPIPGKSLVGIEVPNKAAALVRLSNLMNYSDFQSSGLLSFCVGRDVSGKPIFADIDKMPHLLVAGATGSGKSVMIHSLLSSLLFKNSPESLKLILIDPKRVELSLYSGLPHLIGPVIMESKKAVGVFRWAISEMERRYDTLLQAGARDIRSYNVKFPERPLPYILIVVDELADLMTSYGRDVEGSIVRLAQMARATGLHLVLSTQRPSVEIITGLIKANITSRIAMQVASQVDSRTILDTAGAEKLLGGGDLLFVSAELSKPKRIQGAYISEEEVKKVTEFIKENNELVGDEEEESLNEVMAGGGEDEELFGEISDEEDDLYNEAVEVVTQAKKASASLLQRRLKVGYARAARLLDLMEAKGIIGPGEGAKPREVYLDEVSNS